MREFGNTILYKHKLDFEATTHFLENQEYSQTGVLNFLKLKIHPFWGIAVLTLKQQRQVSNHGKWGTIPKRA